MRFFWILIILTLLPMRVQANMYTMMDEYYIRVVAHPEMIDYYSYGLCKKQVQKHNHRKYDDTHDECLFPEGKNWWHLPDPANYFPSNKLMHKPNLLDVIRSDDESRANIAMTEIVTLFWGGSFGAKWMSVAIPKTPASRKVGQLLVSEAWGKTLSKSFARSVGTLFFDIAAYSLFWEGTTAITDKISHIYHQKTQPFSDYIHYIPEKRGLNEHGIEVNLADIYLPKPLPIPVSPTLIENYGATLDQTLHQPYKDCFPDPTDVSIPKDIDCIHLFFEMPTFLQNNRNTCMQDCDENILKVRGTLSTTYDKYSNLLPGISGATKFENYPINQETGESNTNLLEDFFVYKGDQEICEMRCDQQWRSPSIKELWALVSKNLQKADHHQYARVLMEYQTSILGETVNKITYLTEEEVRKLINRKSKNYKGSCPIGSECDQKHDFFQLKAGSVITELYKKENIFNITKKYSKNVWESMISADYQTIDNLIQQVNNQIQISNISEVTSVEAYSKDGRALNIDELYDESKKLLDLNSQPEGIYIVRIKLKNLQEAWSKKILVKKAVFHG